MTAFARHFLFLFLCLGPASALAQPDTTASTWLDTTLALPEVTVTAARFQTTLAKAPTRVTVLGPRALERSGASSVAELLSEQGGLFVKQYGPGQLATSSLRGAGAAQTLVLLDGHRIADPQLGQLDLSLLPTLLLSSVEVMHGAGSPLYGTDAIGGVINLRTLPAGTAPQVKMLGAAGAFGERRGGMMMSQRVGRWSGLILGEYETSEGDFPYVNEALFPPRQVQRTNADRQRTALYSSVGYRGERHDLRLSGWYTAAERGLPGLATTPPAGERQWDEHLRLWFDDRIGTSWGSLQLGGLLQRSALRYQNPSLDLDNTGRTLISSLEAEGRAAVSKRWVAAGALTAGYGQAAHPQLTNRARQGHVGLVAHGTGHYGRVLAYPALRADAYFLPDGATRSVISPRLSLNAGLAGPLRAKVSAGRVFRMPTFNDRFWQPGGNPDLQPEHGWNVDAGLFGAFGGGRAEVTLFASYLRDQIVWEPSGEGYYAPRNVGRTRTTGLEASYRWNLQAGSYRLGSNLFYTFTDARDRSDPEAPSFNEPLRYVPRQEVKSQLYAGWGPLAADLSARYTGRRYVATDGSQSLNPFLVVDAQLRLTHTLYDMRVQLALELENALDTDYAVLLHRPMPPRHVRLRLVLETNAD